MTKPEMEKKLAEYLDERWFFIMDFDSEERQVIDRAYYNGACAAIAQIGGWERNEDGTHYVKLN